MEKQQQDWFQHSIDLLTYDRNQRVWSIIVTLFGDLARAPGDTISGTLLSRITEPMSIKPEAVRVALHRLRNDGWISSERQGRASHYRLTPYGLEQSEAASPLIYARSPDYPQNWHVIVQEAGRQSGRSKTDKSMKRRGFVVVSTGVYLGTGPAPLEEGALVLNGDLAQVPDWLISRIAPETTRQAYLRLETALDDFSRALDYAPELSDLEIATLRTIIVHIWRRALFSHPDLPPEFFGPDWRGAACRTKVLNILDRLGRPEPSQLEAAKAA